jgi:PAS domain S-box-containing protein
MQNETAMQLLAERMHRIWRYGLILAVVSAAIFVASVAHMLMMHDGQAHLPTLIALIVSFMILTGGILYLAFSLRKALKAAHDDHIHNSRMGAIVRTMLDAVIVLNQEGRIIAFNESAQATFGYTREEAEGQLMGDIIVPDHLKDAHYAGMHRYLATRKRRVVGAGRVELEAKHKDGTVFPVELSINTAQSAEGEIFVSYLRDISAQVAARKELHETRDKALAGEKAKADLLAVMSHEMRTPLNGLIGTLDLLRGTDLSEDQEKYLSMMAASGDLLLHHVNDVLDISRIESGRMQLQENPFELPQVLHRVVNSQEASAKQRGNQIELRLNRAPKTVVGDAGRLEQILVNLVGNAVKFTRDGNVVLEARTTDGGVRLIVQDNGVGIPETDHKRIFDDFVTLDPSYSRDSGGTGLGLAIVRRLVGAMGGTIKLDSTDGAGSTFMVDLPLEVAAEQDHLAELKNPKPGNILEDGKCQILLVEDNAINRMVARGILELENCTVIEAEDGVEGVQIAMSTAFDIILMDISMPRMDGVDATKAIRGQEGPNQNTPIVALTAHAMPEEVATFMAAGMNDVLTKPTSRAALSKALNCFVGTAE